LVFFFFLVEECLIPFRDHVVFPEHDQVWFVGDEGKRGGFRWEEPVWDCSRWSDFVGWIFAPIRKDEFGAEVSLLERFVY
jgi:hypothetical protein